MMASTDFFLWGLQLGSFLLGLLKAVFLILGSLCFIKYLKKE